MSTPGKDCNLHDYNNVEVIYVYVNYVLHKTFTLRYQGSTLVVVVKIDNICLSNIPNNSEMKSLKSSEPYNRMHIMYMHIMHIMLNNFGIILCLIFSWYLLYLYLLDPSITQFF